VWAGVLAQADRFILGLVQQPHAAWLDLVASILSVAGQAEVTSVIALGVAIAWWRAQRTGWWLPLLIVVVIAVETLAKTLIPQAPPPAALSRSVHLLPFLEAPTAFSFPSGHVARVAFLVGAFRWPAALGVAAALVMALTRVYLAEHWPSDVIGGWLLGYLTAVLGYHLTLGTRRR
jgi:membrane-associated phospholipid phosphatase